MSAQTVLIADDDAQIRELLELYLVKEGFAVEQAADGAEAILKAQQLKPDLIILDIMMGGMDGYEFCKHVRLSPEYRGIPIIFLSARVEEYRVASPTPSDLASINSSRSLWFSIRD